MSHSAAAFIMGDYRKLNVWKKAHTVHMLVDDVAAEISSSRHKALCNQMTRSAGSIPSNIVEGSAQESAGEFRRFVGYAISSANETDYHLLAARDLKLISSAQYDDLSVRITEVAKMLTGLKKYLRSIDGRGRKTRSPTNN